MDVAQAEHVAGGSRRRRQVAVEEEEHPRLVGDSNLVVEVVQRDAACVLGEEEEP